MEEKSRPDFNSTLQYCYNVICRLLLVPQRDKDEGQYEGMYIILGYEFIEQFILRYYFSYPKMIDVSKTFLRYFLLEFPN